MDKNLKLSITEDINAPVSKVWQALTDKSTIKKFMWGTDASSDWKKGSSITFEGVYEGKSYHEKGEILEIEKERLMKYTYLSAGNDDKPENYAIITYKLSGSNGHTKMTVIQEGAKDQKALDHSKDGWKSIVGNLKKIVES
jgi:uncharacterized protein YndB with AHSA1/START domain